MMDAHLAQPLPLRQVLDEIITPTFWNLLPCRFASPEAIVMLLAIGLQESRFQHREQVGGPAVSFWQFEKSGGVRGVLQHHATRRYATAVCILRTVMDTEGSVYNAMRGDDRLGCAMARLLLFTDPAPLPEIGDAGAAWRYYERSWQPGKPHPETWQKLYQQAVEAIA